MLSRSSSLFVELEADPESEVIMISKQSSKRIKRLYSFLCPCRQFQQRKSCVKHLICSASCSREGLCTDMFSPSGPLHGVYQDAFAMLCIFYSIMRNPVILCTACPNPFFHAPDCQLIMHFHIFVNAISSIFSTSCCLQETE